MRHHCICLYWANTIGAYAAFTSSETRFLLNVTQNTTEVQWRKSRKLISLWLIWKSWPCHSVLSAVRSLASADVVYITHVFPSWHTSPCEIDIIYIICHLIPAIRQSLPIWQSAFYEIHSPGSSKPTGWEVPSTEEHALLQNNGSPTTALSNSCIYFIHWVHFLHRWESFCALQRNAVRDQNLQFNIYYLQFAGLLGIMCSLFKLNK